MSVSKMSRRRLLQSAAALATSSQVTSPSAVRRTWAAQATPTPSLTGVKGEFYGANVPKTLDLAERSSLAINGLAGTLDVNEDYEVYQLVAPGSNPPYFTHENTGLPTINPKYAEAFPMMRVMGGSDKHRDEQTGMMRAILSRIKHPGLYFVPPATETYRPWTQQKFGGGTEWHANVYGNARLLLGCMAWHQYTGDPAWIELVKTLSQGLKKTAVYKEDYAYYPDGGKGGEPFSYSESGWARVEEPTRDDQVGGESLFMYTGGQARALARAAVLTGNEETLDLSRRICNFMLQPRFWGIESWGKRKDVPEEHELATISGAQRGMWRGHTAGRLEALRGLIEYAIVADDTRIKDFVRSAYEWMRHYGFARVGFFPVILGMVAGGGACGTSRAMALALKLTASGIGDYWEDVDQFVRNVLASGQRLPSHFSNEQLAFSATAPQFAPDAKPMGPGIDIVGCYLTDHALQRCIGTFGHGCCTSNGSTGLYYAWESAIRYEKPLVTVNLLLNRASPWVDVDSFLPYEGKVEIRNKSAKKLAVRIPAWVHEAKIRGQVNGRDTTPFWVGRHLVFDSLTGQEKITITFPMETETTDYTIQGNHHTCTFQGNTLVEGYTFGRRVEHYQSDKLGKMNVKRYIHPVVLEW